jgi:dolichol-phosphate mannosyltransferase
MNDCIVIIPTYNEIENIESIIRSVLSTKPFHILIVDDNSPDHTADKVRV